MGQLDASVVTVALPTLRGSLHAPIGAVEWVVLAYILMLVAAILPVARLADRHGRRRLYLLGFAVFTAGSAGCALSPSLAVLVVARLVQGAGAVFLQANSVALIRNAVPANRIGAAIGVQGAAQAIGLAAGPAVGGALITLAGWRAIFLINVPVGVMGIAAGAALLPQGLPSAPDRRRLDLLGAGLFAAGAGCLVGALSLVAAPGEPAALLAVLSCVALIALFLSWMRQRYRPGSIVDPELMQRRPFLTGCCAALLSYATLFGMLVLTPFLLDEQGSSTLRTGLLLTVLPAALAAVAPIAGRVADRFGARLPSVAGMVSAAAGLVLFAALPGPAAAQFGALLLVGAGEGAFVPAMNASIMRSAPTRRIGAAAGALNLVRSLGTALGVAAAAGALSVAGVRQGFVLLAVTAIGAGAIAALRPMARASPPAR